MDTNAPSVVIYPMPSDTIDEQLVPTPPDLEYRHPRLPCDIWRGLQGTQTTSPQMPAPSRRAMSSAIRQVDEGLHMIHGFG
jgi:hypothetical protein